MMKRRRLIALALTLVLAHGSFAKEPISRLQWASEVLDQKEKRLVRYCTGKFPEQEKSLAADYKVFASRLKKAVRGISDNTNVTDRTIRKSLQSGLMRPPDPVVVTQLQETLEQGMAIAEMRDPGAVCKELSIRMTHMTAEAIGADIEHLLLTEILNSSGTGPPP